MRLRAFGRALALIAAAACSRSLDVPPHVAAHVEETPARDVLQGAVVSDPQILRVLLRELDRDVIVQRERIGVRVDLGVVTLTGSASCALAKERATEAAHVIRGVRAVIDGLTLASQPRSDDELEFSVAGVLSHDPLVADRRLAARAHAGIVQLWGDVDSDATRRIIEADVLALSGVREISDNLGVRPQPTADWRLANEVLRTLNSDPWLRASRARVEARHEVVLLSGSVASAAEWARAEYDARSAAPRRVDMSMLGIESLPDDGTLRTMAEPAPADSEIKQALLDTYAVDPRTQGFLPTVDVRHRVVLLTGLAPDDIALRAADEDARNVQGTLAVHDDLREQQTLAPESDDALLSDVAVALARDARLSALHIGVAVKEGRVFLRGTVPTYADRMSAIGVASSVPGARDVHDALVVRPVRLARQ